LLREGPGKKQEKVTYSRPRAGFSQICPALALLFGNFKKKFLRMHLSADGDNKSEKVGMATPADSAAFNGV
jgi:hypothetical protein